VCASEPRTTGERGWVDVSVPLRSGMVHWPDNPPVRIERMLDIERGDAANVSTISLGSHTGTHMDAPIHFVRGGEGMDRMPLDVTMGPARAIEIQDPTSIKPAALEPHGIGRGERVLFKTRNSSLAWRAVGAGSALAPPSLAGRDRNEVVETAGRFAEAVRGARGR
jgi:arylformamidase